MQNAVSMEQSAARAAGRTRILVPAALAALLGLLIVWGAGFAGPSAIHNAAHDARHANGFPCH
jgi:cobalt transporter subunit CbtB